MQLFSYIITSRTHSSRFTFPTVLKYPDIKPAFKKYNKTDEDTGCLTFSLY